MESSERPNWEFASTGGGDDDGFSDALIETFSGDYEKFLARESIQNSLDAKLDQDKPVRVEFDLLDLKISDIPESEKLLSIFNECILYWKNDNKVQRFFSRAKKIANEQNIKVLRISDYNTIGLRGDDYEKDKEWYNLVKAQGASSKQEEKGGSFGIGKGAPFAASGFRTVFYSTINEKSEFVFQGKARLVSHQINDVIFRGSGSYGLKNQTSIRRAELIPELFRRNERGTDIYILAYLGDEKEWKSNLIKSVLNNFWASILSGRLQVKVGGRYLTEETLEKDLLQFCGTEDSESAYHYYISYKTPTKKFSNELKKIGYCELYVLLQEKSPKNIAFMRKPRMLVRTQPFRSPKAYIGVFLCENSIGNNILRDMEPPSHNDWDPKRIDNGKAVLDEIKNWIRESLRELNDLIESDSLAVPGLEKYFQLPEDYDYEGDIENVFAGEYSGNDNDIESAKEVQLESESKLEKPRFRHHEPIVNKFESGVAGEGNRKRTGKIVL